MEIPIKVGCGLSAEGREGETAATSPQGKKSGKKPKTLRGGKEQFTALAMQTRSIKSNKRNKEVGGNKQSLKKKKKGDHLWVVSKGKKQGPMDQRGEDERGEVLLEKKGRMPYLWSKKREGRGVERCKKKKKRKFMLKRGQQIHFQQGVEKKNAERMGFGLEN